MGDHPDAGMLAAEVRRRLGPPPEMADWPPVSIVVLNRDGAGLLRRLFAGLVERTDYPSLELILVDNASSDDSLDFVRAVEAPFPISIVANTHNESFADACNQGAELASGELLLFLNNDADPFEAGWLRELVACLCGGAAAAVGPTLLQPTAAATATAGYAIHQRGLRAREENGALVPAYRDHLADPLGEGLGVDVETIAVAAACLLIGREVFDRIDGFTHGYWYGPEDVDLALKLREQGMTACCSGRSLLIHPPNSTLDVVADEQRRQWTQGNRLLFAEHWGPRLRREFELDRLRGHGLWAEPDGSGAGRAQAEVEALGFCIKAAPEPSGDTVAMLNALSDALRRHGHRCLVACGDAAESPTTLDHDVAVHLRGAWRYVPRLAQLNVLWSRDDPAALSTVERSRYDAVLDGGQYDSPDAVERFAERLLEVSAERAAATGFKTRVEPEP